MILEQKETKQNIIIGGIGLMISMLFLLPLALYPILKNSDELSFSGFLISRFYCWFCLLAMYIYSIKVEKQKFLIWTEKQYPLSFYLKFFILAPLILLVAGIVVGVILKSFNLNPGHLSANFNLILKNHKLMILFASITAGMTEELLFRGYLMSRLELVFKNNDMPILLSAIVFALAHLGYQSAVKLVVVFLIGLALAFLYYRYRNIKILIILHCLIDLTALSISTLK